MASTINAITTGAGGVATTADSSGILDIQTAGTTAIEVNASQQTVFGDTTASTLNSDRIFTAGTGALGNISQVRTGVSTNGPGLKQYKTRGATATTQGTVVNGDSLGVQYVYASDGTSYVQVAQQTYQATGTISTGVIPTSWALNLAPLSGGGLPQVLLVNQSGFMFGYPNSNTGAGLYQASQYYRLDSGLTGANATGAQSLFGVGVTLAGSTVYEFEMQVTLVKTAGTTSHNFSMLFGGTATLNNIYYNAMGNQNNASWPQAGTTPNMLSTTNAATATLLTSGITSAAQYVNMLVKGTVSINAGGTFIPQYTLSAAPGGAYTTQAGSYIKISPLGASGANINIGSWA